MIIGNTLNCLANSGAQKKVSSGHPGQLDCSTGQVTLHSPLSSMDKGSSKSSASELIKSAI